MGHSRIKLTLRTRIGLLLLAIAAVLAGGCARGKSPTSTPEATSVPSTATTTATATPPGASATPTRVPTDGVAAVDLVVGSATPFPPNTAFTIASGCTQCDGPLSSIERVYRNEGALRADTLFRLPGAEIGKPEVEGRYIFSVATAAGGDILLTVCETGYCGGVGNVSTDASTSVRRSRDGGVTWTTEQTLAGGAGAVHNAGLDALLYRVTFAADGSPRFAYTRYPSGQAAELGGTAARDAVVLRSGSGPPLRRGEDGIRLYRVDGNNLYFDPHLPPGSLVLNAQPIGRYWAVTWYGPEGSWGRATYTSLVEFGSGIAVRTFRWTDPIRFVYANGATIDDHTLVVNAFFEGSGHSPALLDLTSGRISPIAELAVRGTRDHDRLVVLAAERGPFARVARAGDCLNVRARPSTASESLGCFADGALLREGGVTVEAEGRKWVAVATPAGRTGWAAETFLDTSGTSGAAAFYPPGTQTSIPGLDRAIVAVASGDPAQIRAVVSYTTIPCTNRQGIGVAAACPPGVAEGGQTFEVFIGGACEGYGIPRADFERDPKLPFGPDSALYAVYRNGDGGFTLIYQYAAHRVEAGTLTANAEGKLTAFANGCGASARDLTRDIPAARFILPPRTLR